MANKRIKPHIGKSRCEHTDTRRHIHAYVYVCTIERTHFHMMPLPRPAKMCSPSAVTTRVCIDVTFALFQSSQASLLFGSHLRFIHEQGSLVVVDVLVVDNDCHYGCVRYPCSPSHCTRSYIGADTYLHMTPLSRPAYSHPL